MDDPITMPTYLAFVMPGGWEWVVIGVIALLLFGSRLPHVARSLGDALKEFKKGVREASKSEDETDAKTDTSASRRFESVRTPTDADGQDHRVPQEAVSTGDPADPSGVR